MNCNKNKLAKIQVLIFSLGLIFFTSSRVFSKPLNNNESQGETIYRNGILPSGQSLTAIVAGDIEVSGKQFSCMNCHGRSGMGTIEGNYIVPPIAGKLLFTDANQPVRSAYNNSSLATLLREGINPDGKAIDPLMPRFIINDEQVSVLANYLARLSSEIAPGINDTTIHLATIVTDGVDANLATAVASVLQRFVIEKNRQTRLEAQRPNRGKRPELRSASLFRNWSLDVWHLKGRASTWKKQLENYYNRQPVFALLGGLTMQSWQPIGEFCELNQIPCMFPSVNVSGAKEGDFYTYHFSRGIELEADLVANYLDENPAQKLNQIYCKGTASYAAKRLSLKMQRQSAKLNSLAIDCDDPKQRRSDLSGLADRIQLDAQSDLVLWVDQKTLEILINKSILQDDSYKRLFLSSYLTAGDFSSIINRKGKDVLVAQGIKLPGKYDSAFKRFQLWAKLRKIKVTHPRFQAEAFFACLAMKDALNHIRRYRVRDYLLDVMDHSQGLELYLPFYPQPSLGPRQRFLSKSGYIVPLIDGNLDTAKAEFIEP